MILGPGPLKSKKVCTHWRPSKLEVQESFSAARKGVYANNVEGNFAVAKLADA